jgi:hypothetical protein
MENVIPTDVLAILLKAVGTNKVLSPEERTRALTWLLDNGELVPIRKVGGYSGAKSAKTVGSPKRSDR